MKDGSVIQALGTAAERSFVVFSPGHIKHLGLFFPCRAGRARVFQDEHDQGISDRGTAPLPNAGGFARRHQELVVNLTSLSNQA